MPGRLRNAEASSSLLQHLARAIVAGGSHYAAAGMRAGTAQEQALNGTTVAGPTGHGAHDEHLVEAHFAVENIAARDAETAFQIERRQHLAVLDDGTYVGNILPDEA